MLELDKSHLKKLEELARQGYELVSFALFPSHIGVRKGSCAALLEATPDGRLRIFGQPGWLVENNISVLVRKEHGTAFVWKEYQVPATDDRLQELARFAEGLEEKLAGIQ